MTPWRWSTMRAVLSNSFRSWQSSTIVALVVAPLALDQLVAFFNPTNDGDQRAYARIVLLVVVLLGVLIFAVVAWQDYKRKLAQKRASNNFGLVLLEPSIHQRVTALVIQSQKSKLGKEVSLPEFLLKNFTNVREVALVGSEGGETENWPDSAGIPLRETIKVPHLRGFTDGERDDVLRRLQGLLDDHRDGMVLVDITRGTKAMSFNMAEVARVLNLLVTYTPLHDGKYSGIYCLQAVATGGTDGSVPADG